ncbi:ABC transporter permease [Aestuariibacter salexigens]|uniref:ABC transporter permease n=1 Tax=Aestuariibacter salexigens TaxID=226010 RepID=UPI00047E97BA|nr:iron ABC transporter permease [Aestuariibacter salexigens]
MFKRDPWHLLLLVISALLMLPVLAVVASLLEPQWQTWRHLADTVLSGYVLNSVILAIGTGIVTLVIGTALAYCIERYEFYGRRWLRWLALLPLAMPAYIIAYTYTGLLDFAGPVQTALRDTFGWRYGQYWFPEIRSMAGAITMMGLVLYPYVYILARSAFREESQQLRMAAMSLGESPHMLFWRVSLPLARPALFTGSALAMMEALADYGTVQYFGIPTLTTGIFRTWFGMGNETAAAQMSALLCSVVLVLLWWEQYSRRQQRYHQQTLSSSTMPRQRLSKGKALLMTLLCMLPVLCGFIIPLLQLSSWAMLTWHDSLTNDFFTLALNSFMLAFGGAIVTVIVALFLCYGKRIKPDWLANAQVRIASLGYAIPGTVIAVGIMVPLTALDRGINAWLFSLFEWRPGLIFSGTVFALLLAYCIRFLSVAIHNVDSGLARITPSMDQAAKSLGRSTTSMLRDVHAPLLKGSLLSAILLVFVDILKELPATLILRPFNFNTLAVRAYEMASDERLVDAAWPSISIVLVGILPIIFIMRALEKN